MKPSMPVGIAAQVARRHSCVMRLKAGVARLAGGGTMDDSADPAGSEAAQRHKTAQVFANVYADCAGVPPVPPFFQTADMSGWTAPEVSASHRGPRCAPVLRTMGWKSPGVPIVRRFCAPWVEAATPLRNA